MIAWHKVYQKEEDGGLGVKDNKVFNKALIQKLVWQLMTEQDRVSFNIVKTKYFPQESFFLKKEVQIGYSLGITCLELDTLLQTSFDKSNTLLNLFFPKS